MAGLTLVREWYERGKGIVESGRVTIFYLGIVKMSG